MSRLQLGEYQLVSLPTRDPVDWDFYQHFCWGIPSVWSCVNIAPNVFDKIHHKTLTDFTGLACGILAMSQLWAVTHATSNTTYNFQKGICSPIFDRLGSTSVQVLIHCSLRMEALGISSITIHYSFTCAPIFAYRRLPVFRVRLSVPRLSPGSSVLTCDYFTFY